MLPSIADDEEHYYYSTYHMLAALLSKRRKCRTGALGSLPAGRASCRRRFLGEEEARSSHAAA